MLSRVADSLYWMSRYLERAEHTARLVSVNLHLTLDRTPADSAHHWGRLLSSLRMPPPAPESMTSADQTNGATLDLTNRDAIAASIGAARENARQVREQISSEMWEQMNRLFLAVRRDVPDASWTSHTHEFLSSVMEGVHLFQGITDATMTHGEGWQVHRAGPLHRARQRHSRITRRALSRFSRRPRPAGRGRRVRGVGGAAAIVLCV